MEKGDPVHKDVKETKKDKATYAAKKEGHTQSKHSAGDKAALRARQQKKSERNFAKKMERRAGGGKTADSPSRDDFRKKAVHQRNVDGQHRERGGGKESPSSTGRQESAGKGSGKKRTIDRKALGKLVDVNLRTEEVKGQSPSVTPKKEIQRPVREAWRQGDQVDSQDRSMNERIDEETEKETQYSGKAVTGSMEEQEAELEQTYIFKLAKRSLKFPRALYYCRLCNYHIDTLSMCWVHIDQSRHNRLAKAKESENFFRNLPVPSPSHARALTKLLSDVVEEHAMTGREMNQRTQVAGRVETILQEDIPDCKIKLYGSSLSSFGFHDSDINLDLEVPGEKQASKVLMALSQAIADKVDKDFVDFEPDFEGKHPCVRFRDKKTKLVCEVGTANQHAVQASQLMVQYNECDGRLRPLVLGLRYWARICGIDQQAIGAMPAHTFVLLVIYYLQQCTPPILPILQQNEKMQTENKKTVGELWVSMLRFYLVDVNIEEIVISIRQREPVLRADFKLPNRRIAIEDPFANGKKNVAKSLTTSSVFQYIMDRFHDALKYFGIPQNGLPEQLEEPSNAPETDLGTNDAMETEPSMNHTGTVQDRVGSTENGDDKERSEEDESGMESCDKESVDPASDLGAKLAELVVSEVEQEETGPRTSKTSSLDGDSEAAVQRKDEDMTEADAESSRKNSESSPASSRTEGNSSTRDSILPSDNGDSIHADSAVGTESDSQCAFNKTQDSTPSSELENTDRSSIQTSKSLVSELPQEKKESETSENEQGIESTLDSQEGEISDDDVDDEDVDYVFTFDKEILTRGEEVQLVCTNCLKEGHVSKDCPDDTLPPLDKLPPMDPKFLEFGTVFCEQILCRNHPNPVDLRNREQCVLELEYYIRQHAFADAQLSLFGSSGNGFGLRNSDLDICLTFHRKTVKDVDVVYVVEHLAGALKRNRSLYNIIPIPTAKVPIVKFVHRPTRLEGDISLYNTLAQCNTRLLSMYSKIDVRVKNLGYSMKYLAKFCDIGDASRGSLSSYAYTLLTIYFLQQRKPPVLPVLQELHEGEKPVVEVDGWNAWFYDNLNQLPRVWRWLGVNKESVGSLWLGMLRFYTEEFDFTKFVVSIRMHKPLTRFEKLWMTPARGIAIEDPFDLDHNLGGAASKKMATYIIQIFRNARQVFGTPRRIHSMGPRPNREDIMKYFLNIDVLSGGEAPPNDRGCRICGKIGHFVKDCPVKRRGQDRKEQEKRERERRDKSSPSPKENGTPIKNSMRDGRAVDSPLSRGPDSATKQTNSPLPRTPTSEIKQSSTPKSRDPGSEVKQRESTNQRGPGSGVKRTEPLSQRDQGRDTSIDSPSDVRQKDSANQRGPGSGVRRTDPLNHGGQERDPSQAMQSDQSRLKDRQTRQPDSKKASGNASATKQPQPASGDAKKRENSSKKSKDLKEQGKPAEKPVVRQLYPVEPIPIKKEEDDMKMKQTAPSTAKDEKPFKKGVKRSLDYNTAAPSPNPAQTNPIQSGVTTSRNKPSIPRSEIQIPGISSLESGTKLNQASHSHVSEQAMHSQADSEFVQKLLQQPQQHSEQYQQQTVQPQQQHHLQQHNKQQQEIGYRKPDGHQQLGPNQPPFPNPVGGNPNGPQPHPRMPTSALNTPRPPTTGLSMHSHPPPQHFMGLDMLPPAVLQQQQQHDLAALFKMVGKAPPPGHGQPMSPTQGPLVRAPTIPTTAQTLDEIENQLKSKQQQQQDQQQQTPPRLPPGAKSLEQLEQQYRQDQFFQLREQQKPYQHQGPQQRGNQQQEQQQKQMLQQQQQHGFSPSSQMYNPIGSPTGLGYCGMEQDRERQQAAPFSGNPFHNKSQPIPITEKQPQQSQQWQQKEYRGGWGSPISPPSPHVADHRFATSPLGQQQHGHTPTRPQATSPPHNLLQTPPGSSTPPMLPQFGPSPFGPSVLPSVLGNIGQQHPGAAISPPHHVQPQHAAPGFQHTGWPQHQHGLPAQQHGWQQQAEPQSASANSPRSPPAAMPMEAQYQLQQAFGQGPLPSRQDSSQPFHFSPIAINPNLPRSSHMAQQLPSHNASQAPLPHHHQQVNPSSWQQQQQQQPYLHSGQSSMTTAVVGAPIMSHEEQSHNSRFSHNAAPHQPMRSGGMPP